MPNFTDYDVAYTNMKPWNNINLGSGNMRVSIPNGSSSIKAKLKRIVERKINSLGVRIDSFKEVDA